jgi:hypothetical protein
MQTLPTYREQYDKIIQAYFKDEIKPYNSNFCFCGTLAPDIYARDGYKNWNNHAGGFNKKQQPYTLEEYYRMEKALFLELNAYEGRIDGKTCSLSSKCLERHHDGYEDALFAGMCAALDELKKIHEERGEVIDEVPEFTKRNLALLNT